MDDATVKVKVEPDMEMFESSFATLTTYRNWPSLIPQWLTAAATVGILIDLLVR